ncbi:MAG: hypothetical protein LKE41_00930 [Prevotella sp.]|jgi:hypothetical protein|nr:hypothetical protein [Prevotella sp.]
MEEYIDRLITNIRFDVNTGEDFFEALTREISYGDADLEHIELDNGVDAITSRYADGFSYKEDSPYTYWDLETVQAFAQEFNMKVVALKKFDCDSDWNMTNDFDEYDCTKGLSVMDYCKDIEYAYVFDTVDDVEKAYNEYIENIEEQFTSDDRTLLEELDKARKGKEEIIEQVKRKASSEFVMIPEVDFDAYGLEIMPKFSTMFYDSYNGVSYALGLIPKED